MITLLLTLFICVFSYCPSINKLEDHKENTIQVNESYNEKRIANYNDGVYFLSSGDITFENYYYGLIGFFGVQFGYNYDTNFAYEFTQADEINDLQVLDYTVGQDLYDNTGYVVNSWIVSKTWVDAERCVYSLYIKYNNDANAFLRIDWITIFGNYAESELTGKILVEQTLYQDSGHALSYWTGNKIIGVYGFSDSVFASIFIKDSYGSFDYSTGYNNGYTYGYNSGYTSGYNNGKSNGYQEGYSQAITDSAESSSTAYTIFTGVLEIGLLPVNFFLSIFNYEVFGINIKSIVSALLTLAVVIIIIRFLFGGNNNDK